MTDGDDRMDTYRTEAGRRLLQAWCCAELAHRCPGAERRVVDSPLGPTHLTSCGAAAAHVVLVPDVHLNAATSSPLIASLAASHRVTVVDVPGRPGLSCGTRPLDDLIGRYRDWLDGVLSAVGGGPVVLAGESGGAAVTLCATPGPRIAGLLLSAPAGVISARVTPTVLRASLPWLLRPSPARSARLLEAVGGDRPMADRGPLTEWMTLVARYARGSALAPVPLPTAVLREWRDTPSRVLLGDRDPLFPPRRMEAPVRCLLGGRTVVVPGAGHLLSHTDPAALVAAASELAAGTDGAAG